jgi:hypothetical protein
LHKHEFVQFGGAGAACDFVVVRLARTPNKARLVATQKIQIADDLVMGLYLNLETRKRGNSFAATLPQAFRLSTSLQSRHVQ